MVSSGRLFKQPPASDASNGANGEGDGGIGDGETAGDGGIGDGVGGIGDGVGATGDGVGRAVELCVVSNVKVLLATCPVTLSVTVSIPVPL